jgi:transposase
MYYPNALIVERTFGWWNQYRRLSKDYELLPPDERVYDCRQICTDFVLLR